MTPLDEALALRFIEQRPNPCGDHRELIRAKAESCRARWAWLQITDPGPPVAAPGA